MNLLILKNTKKTQLNNINHSGGGGFRGFDTFNKRMFFLGSSYYSVSFILIS